MLRSKVTALNNTVSFSTITPLNLNAEDPHTWPNNVRLIGILRVKVGVTRGPWALALCLTTYLAIGQSSKSSDIQSLSIPGRRN